MLAFTVTATATGFPSWKTSVPSGGGTVTTTLGGGSVIGGSGGGGVVVVNGGTVVVVVGVDGVEGVEGVVGVGVVVVGEGVAGAGAGTAVWTATGYEICVARGRAVTGAPERTTACCSSTEVRACRATRCGTATGFACEVATTTCVPLGVGVASSRPTASSAPT